MRLTHLSALFLIALQLPYQVLADPAADKGYKIMKVSDKKNSGFTGETSSMEMVLINARGDKVTRKMDGKVKEVKNDGDKSIITFKWPADVNGTKMLTWSHAEDSDDQWLYLPALKRVKRITSRNKTGSFMGSEFSYEDLGSQEVDKYSYKFIKSQKLNKRTVWVIERRSKDKNSGYAKEIVYQDKKYFNPLKVEYFDRKNELLKIATFSGYKKIGKFWRVSKILMKNVQTKKQSILIWKKRTLNQKFSDAEFNQNRLKI